ncbi:hypothetical protein HWV62_42315 [Athelia sp. TMB]|nr:hypothetical protein HWV62_17074 [Athelia sp. TMB]KAF7979482.1 hypothetical protein HWV62_42315 [Athelia sp. TMB]
MSQYERLPTSPYAASPPASRSPSPEDVTRMSPRSSARIAAQNRELQRQTDMDPRFNMPKPAWWQRVALILFVIFLFWLGQHLHVSSPEPSKIVHATRYSKDYKFRPAASPVITEKLKDGRVRLRGAHPNHGL